MAIKVEPQLLTKKFYQLLTHVYWIEGTSNLLVKLLTEPYSSHGQNSPESWGIQLCLSYLYQISPDCWNATDAKKSLYRYAMISAFKFERKLLLEHQFIQKMYVLSSEKVRIIIDIDSMPLYAQLLHTIQNFKCPKWFHWFLWLCFSQQSGHWEHSP